MASFDVMTLQLTAREPPSPLFATAANEAEATLTFRETRRQYDVDRNPHAVAHTEVERAGGTGTVWTRLQPERSRPVAVPTLARPESAAGGAAVFSGPH